MPHIRNSYERQDDPVSDVFLSLSIATFRRGAFIGEISGKNMGTIKILISDRVRESLGWSS